MNMMELNGLPKNIELGVKMENNVSDRFDFEQQIIKCWNITNDLKEICDAFMNYESTNFTQDRVVNTLTGVAELYEIKFNKLWELFETVVMEEVRKNKFLEEECSTLRKQFVELKNVSEK